MYSRHRRIETTLYTRTDIHTYNTYNARCYWSARLLARVRRAALIIITWKIKYKNRSVALFARLFPLSQQARTQIIHIHIHTTNHFLTSVSPNQPTNIFSLWHLFIHRSLLLLYLAFHRKLLTHLAS